MTRMLKLVLLCMGLLGVAGCSSVGVGYSVPVGIGGVGVSVRSDGTVGAGVGVGRGGVGVGVGTSTRLPPRKESPPDTPAERNAPKPP